LFWRFVRNGDNDNDDSSRSLGDDDKASAADVDTSGAEASSATVAAAAAVTASTGSTAKGKIVVDDCTLLDRVRSLTSAAACEGGSASAGEHQRAPVSKPTIETQGDTAHQNGATAATAVGAAAAVSESTTLAAAVHLTPDDAQSCVSEEEAARLRLRLEQLIDEVKLVQALLKKTNSFTR
jgi:hypothetical protein